MQACAIGRDCGTRCAPLDSVNGCFAPLNPTSSPKPPTGTRALPVTNWSSCGSRPDSSGEDAQDRTVRQNHATSSLSRARPCEYAVCCSQSSMLISPSPLRSCDSSVGAKTLLSSWSIGCGTTLCNPRAIAAICGSIPPNIRHSASASTNSALFSSVTTCSSPASPSAASATSTRKSRMPGQERAVPGTRSFRWTTRGSIAAGESCARLVAPSVSLGSCVSSRASSLARGSEKGTSNPSSATGLARSHLTFSRSSSSSTSASVVLISDRPKPNSSAQTCGCSGRSRVQLCQSARPRSLPRASKSICHCGLQNSAAGSGQNVWRRS
mmetsp:Transcript_3911/g.11137  ORF Transcript_3911/g.11137 Transcript_3911/m.11137 type:complete len:325 (+) Transcript_3911:169-1143(+)